MASQEEEKMGGEGGSGVLLGPVDLEPGLVVVELATGTVGLRVLEPGIGGPVIVRLEDDIIVTAVLKSPTVLEHTTLDPKWRNKMQ